MKTSRLHHLSLLLISSFSLGSINAQIDPGNVREGEQVEYCKTHKKMEALKSNPEFMKAYQESQEILKQEIDKLEKEGPVRGDIKHIPVVFHLLHNNGSEKISDQQIYDAFYILNRDYRRRNADTADVVADFHDRIGDTEVEFSLATTAPDGTKFNGITHTQSAATSSGDGQTQLQAVVQGNDVYKGEWAGDEYLNIVIAENIGGAAGYTQTPFNWGGWGASMGNGIYVLSDYVGSIGTGTVGRSRTLTHEVGHWLNLEHPWGPNNNPGNASSCGSDDGVTDTPNTIGVTSCNLTEKTCGPLANVENFMDYSYCSKMFTQGQVNRMRAALNSSVGGRNNLSTTENLTGTGSDYLILANFDASKSSVCNTGEIQFFDKSYNYIVERSWSFPGASVASSSKADPIVSYDSPGVYPVTLTVSDGKSSMTKTKYVRVYGEPRVMPILDGFELYESVGNTLEWEVFNQEDNPTFEVVEGVAYTGNKSIRLNNYDSEENSVDELVSSIYDLSEVTSSSEVTISFKYAYRKRDASNSEKLQVLYSDDCGETWNIRKTLLGNSLGSEVVTDPWAPASQGDWKLVHLTNITSNFWNSSFRFKFRFEGRGGNNLYLDDINIYASGPSNVNVGEETDPSVGINELSAMELAFQVFPNPAEDKVNVAFNLEQDANVQLEMIDLMGKQVVSNHVRGSKGSNLVVIPATMAKGVYLLKLTIGNQVFTKRQIIK